MRGRLSTDCLASGGIGCISNRKGNTEMITIRKKETVYFINIVTSLPEALEAHTHRLLWGYQAEVNCFTTLLQLSCSRCE